MRSVCLTVKTEKGEQKCAGVDESSVALNELAKTIRQQGFARIDGEAIPVVSGVLFSTSNVGPIYQFSCEAAKLKGKK